MTDNEFNARIEQNKVIANVIRGYQRQLAEARAELARKDAALVKIAEMPAGGCVTFDETPAKSWIELCDRCGEAHDIARAALEAK